MKKYMLSLGLTIVVMPVRAQALKTVSPELGVLFIILGCMVIVVSLVLWIVIRIKNAIKIQLADQAAENRNFQHHLADLDAQEIAALLAKKKYKSRVGKSSSKVLMIILGMLLSNSLFAQSSPQPSLLSQPGVILTLLLIFIPLFVSILLLVFKANRAILRFQHMRKEKEATRLADYLLHLEGEEIDANLLKRKSSLEYQLNNTELSGVGTAEDTKGIIQRISDNHGSNFVPMKKRATKRPTINPQLSRLILWYLGCAIFWLVFGTTVGEYIGIKFVAPDVDHLSWLSFGRLN